jgi:hypothetical protein
MGLVRLALKLAGILALVVGAVGGILYATDYGVEASVAETHCAGSGNPFFPGLPAATPTPAPAPAAAQPDSTVTVVTDVLGLRRTVSLPSEQCHALRPDNFVVYHVRSGHTTLYRDATKAVCLWDSDVGVPCE